MAAKKKIRLQNAGSVSRARLLEGDGTPTTGEKKIYLQKLKNTGYTATQPDKQKAIRDSIINEAGRVNSNTADIIRDALPVPRNVGQMIAKSVFKDARMSNSSLDPVDKAALWDVIQNAKKRTGTSAGGTEYSDYAGQYGSADQFNSWFNRGKIGVPDLVYNSTFNPGFKLASTIGRGKYYTDPETGDVAYTDVYDWNATKEKNFGSGDPSQSLNAYQTIRNSFRGSEDTDLNKEKNEPYRMNFLLKRDEIEKIKQRLAHPSLHNQGQMMLNLGMMQSGGKVATDNTSAPIKTTLNRKGVPQKTSGDTITNGQMADEVFKLIDPTGITNYPDMIDAYRHGDWQDQMMETMASLPMVGDAGRLIKGVEEAARIGKRSTPVLKILRVSSSAESAIKDIAGPLPEDKANKRANGGNIKSTNMKRKGSKKYKMGGKSCNYQNAGLLDNVKDNNMSLDYNNPDHQGMIPSYGQPVMYHTDQTAGTPSYNYNIVPIPGAKPDNSFNLSKSFPWIDAGMDSLQGVAGLIHERDNIRNEQRLRIKALQPGEQELSDHYRFGLNPENFLHANGGKWLKGATNPDHKGYCTPMTKSTCTPKRKAFAKTMKKHHGFHQNAGIVDMGGDNNPNPEVYAETGEVARMRDGSYGYIDPNMANTYDHGESKGIPGTPVDGAESFLEATSTKKGRNTIVDKLLRVSPDAAEQLTGFRPKTTVSHATLMRKADEFHDKQRIKVKNKLQEQMEGDMRTEAARNSIILNRKTYQQVPTTDQLYNNIFAHQESVKKMFNIPDAPTEAQESQYSAQNGKMLMDDTHPFKSFDDVHDFYQQRFGYNGKPGDVAAWQSWMANSSGIKPYLLSYLRSPGVDVTNKGRRLYGKNIKPSDLNDEQLLNQFQDGLFDYRSPKFNNGTFPQLLRDPAIQHPVLDSSYPELTDDHVTHEVTDQDTLKNQAPGNTKPGDFPLEWYDTLPGTAALIASYNRDPETFVDVKQPRVKYKLLDPTRQLQEIDTDANAAVQNGPQGTQGMGFKAQVQANRLRSKSSVLGNYDNQNVGIVNREEDVNADYAGKENILHAQATNNFIDNYLKSRAVSEGQRLQAIDAISKTVAKNAQFNRMVHMLDPKHYTVGDDGTFNFDGQWAVHDPTMSLSSVVGNSSAAPKASQFKTKVGKDGYYYILDVMNNTWKNTGLKSGTAGR